MTYVSENNDLMLDWDWKKNDAIGLDPTVLKCGSNKTAFWKCHICGREYTTRIERKFHGAACRMCLVKERAKARYEESLAALYPEIAKEWDFDLNEGGPDTIYPQSNKHCHWVCKNGHRWTDSVSHRTARQTPCPICSGKKVLTGYNDLSTTHKELLKEWDWEKNDSIGVKPSEITYGSKKKVYWKCVRGHSWQAVVYARTTGKCGCRQCSAELKMSFPEKAIGYYLSAIFPDCVENYRDESLKRFELDVYIPSLKVGVEYDGRFWHKNPENDKAKDDLCEKLGIKLIRVREKGCVDYESSSLKLYLKSRNNEELTSTIVSVIELVGSIRGLSLSADVNVDRDASMILSSLLTIEKRKSIADCDFAQDWDWGNNPGINPSMVPLFSNRKFRWKCHKCGYEWSASASHRASGRGCARCAGQVLRKGENDLESKFPDIAKEWDSSKNALKPNEVAAFSNKKYWWKCSKCGHSWETEVYVRTGQGCGCPECKRRILSEKMGRRVKNLDTGVVYGSVNKAAAATGLNVGSISSCCNGKTKQAGGFRWRYIDSGEQ